MAISVLPTIVMGGGTAIMGGCIIRAVVQPPNELVHATNELVQPPNEVECGDNFCCDCGGLVGYTVGGGCCICCDNCPLSKPLSSPSGPSVLIGLSEEKSGVDLSSFTASSLTI